MSLSSYEVEKLTILFARFLDIIQAGVNEIKRANDIEVAKVMFPQGGDDFYYSVTDPKELKDEKKTRLR